MANGKDVSSCKQHAQLGGKITSHQVVLVGDAGQVRQKKRKKKTVTYSTATQHIRGCVDVTRLHTIAGRKLH